VFVIIAIMVLVWSAIFIEEIVISGGNTVLMQAMIAALSCVVPYLCEYVTNAITPFVSHVNI
jgi:hypothetical protein